MTAKGTPPPLALALTALAGYVDAVGFLQSGGTFLSFMSGNSTRIAAGLGAGTGALSLTAIVLAAFLLGAIVGHLLRRASGQRPQAAVLTLVTVLLAAAAAAYDAGWTLPALAIAATAMGAINATFERDGENSVSLTYVSGTVVKLGDQIANALGGGKRWDWVAPLTQWLCFAGGAVVGGAVFDHLHLDTVWLAAAGTAVAAIVSRRG